MKQIRLCKIPHIVFMDGINLLNLELLAGIGDFIMIKREVKILI
jgi:hypothetical protein